MAARVWAPSHLPCRAAHLTARRSLELAPLGLPLQLDFSSLRSQRVLRCLEFNVGLRHACNLLSRPHLKLLARLCLHLSDPLLSLDLLGIPLSERLILPIVESRELLVADLLADLLLQFLDLFAFHQQINEHLLLALQRRLTRALDRDALRSAVPEGLLRLEVELAVACPRDVDLCDPLALRLLDRAHRVDHVQEAVLFLDLVLLCPCRGHLHRHLTGLALNLLDKLL
mmetsp:Transcript_13884/g.41448  ORF Transcript_13884/g.41448 Transcript_13884/m.41448 type:complete len:228 (+) Transcript_13884:35-718(+)